MAAHALKQSDQVRSFGQFLSLEDCSATHKTNRIRYAKKCLLPLPRVQHSCYATSALLRQPKECFPLNQAQRYRLTRPSRFMVATFKVANLNAAVC